MGEIESLILCWMAPSLRDVGEGEVWNGSLGLVDENYYI